LPAETDSCPGRMLPTPEYTYKGQCYYSKKYLLKKTVSWFQPSVECFHKLSYSHAERKLQYPTNVDGTCPWEAALKSSRKSMDAPSMVAIKVAVLSKFMEYFGYFKAFM
jgi:hypothetical protein